MAPAPSGEAAPAAAAATRAMPSVRPTAAVPVRPRLGDGRALMAAATGERQVRRHGRPATAAPGGGATTTRCARRSAGARRRARPPRSRRRGWPSARRGAGAARRARRRGPGRDAGARPADRPAPPSPEPGVDAVGQRAHDGSQPASASAAATVARRWRRAGRAGRCRPRSRRTDAGAGAPSRRRPARRRGRGRRRSTAAEHDLARPGRRRPRSDVEQGGLAAAARPGQRHDLAGLDHEVGAVQGRDRAGRGR